MRRLALAGGALWAANAAPAVVALAPWAAPAIGVRTRLAPDGPVGLTFDDGPHRAGTPAVLAALAARGVRATFFLVGEQVRRDPGLAAEVAAAGHDVALHCDRHRNLLRLAPRQVHDDLLRAAATIEDATGRELRLWRPPYGVLSTAGLLVARRHGWAPVLWSRDGADWRGDMTAETIARRIADGVRGGDVLLLHDADHYSSMGSWERTAGAVPLVLDAIERAGLRAGPV